MKRIISFVAVAGVLAATFVLAAPNALAACSNATLHGGYGATITGTVSGSPLAELDLVSADGNGHLNGIGTLSFMGAVTSITITATYTVNANCSGSASFNNGTTQNLIIKQDGSEVLFIGTNDPNAQVTGDAKRL